MYEESSPNNLQILYYVKGFRRNRRYFNLSRTIHIRGRPYETIGTLFVLDAAGHLVIPGLINTHGHIPMVLLRGIADDLRLMDWLEDYTFPTEAASVTPEFVYWGSLLACIEMARSGTTTFVDMYYFEEQIARATERAGLRGVLGQTIIGISSPDYKSTEEALAC